MEILLENPEYYEIPMEVKDFGGEIGIVNHPKYKHDCFNILGYKRDKTKCIVKKYKEVCKTDRLSECWIDYMPDVRNIHTADLPTFDQFHYYD